MSLKARRHHPLLGCLGLLLTLVLPVSYSPVAQAQIQSCTATSPSIGFGNVDVVSGTNYSTSSSITVTCNLSFGITGSANFSVCLNIGLAGSGAYRTMTSGANSLNYNLYADSAHTTIWGSYYSAPPNPVVVNMTVSSLILGGSISSTVPIYGLLSSSQNLTAPAGAYAQSLGGNNTAVTYNYSYSFFFLPGTPTPCTSNGGTGSNTFAFTPTATVVNNCLVSATNINFGGSVGVLTSAVSANGTITATCTSGDVYTIALDKGTSTSGSIIDRRMQASGGTQVHYELYTTTAHTTVWGDGTSSSATNGGTGTGSAQTYTVYGQIPAQTTPAPGSFSDTITVTVTY